MSPMPDATGYLASHATKFGRGAGARGRVRSGWLGLSQTSRKTTRRYVFASSASIRGGTSGTDLAHRPRCASWSILRLVPERTQPASQESDKASYLAGTRLEVLGSTKEDR